MVNVKPNVQHERVPEAVRSMEWLDTGLALLGFTAASRY